MQKRPKTQPEINEFRRGGLKEAALRVIAEQGYENATVGRIAAEAGVSRGLINHYYPAKDELVLAAYHDLMDRVTAETRAAALLHEAAVDRIVAIIDTVFSPAVSDRISRDAYLAYWGASRANPLIRKATRDHYARYRRTMHSLITRAGEETGLRVDPDRLATGMVCLMDGMWLQLSLGIAGVTPAIAVQISKDYLRAHIPGLAIR